MANETQGEISITFAVSVYCTADSPQNDDQVDSQACPAVAGKPEHIKMRGMPSGTFFVECTDWALWIRKRKGSWWILEHWTEQDDENEIPMADEWRAFNWVPLEMRMQADMHPGLYMLSCSEVNLPCVKEIEKYENGTVRSQRVEFVTGETGRLEHYLEVKALLQDPMNAVEDDEQDEFDTTLEFDLTEKLLVGTDAFKEAWCTFELRSEKAADGTLHHVMHVKVARMPEEETKDMLRSPNKRKRDTTELAFA